MKYRSYRKNDDKKNDTAQLILNQSIISFLIVFVILILNLVPSAKNIMLDLKQELSKNISVEQVKSQSSKILNFIGEKVSDQKDYYVDEKLIEQINQDEQKFNEIKKNFSAQI